MNSFDLSLLIKNRFLSQKIKNMQKLKMLLSIALFPVLFLSIIISMNTDPEVGLSDFQIAVYFLVLGYILFYFVYLAWARIYLNQTRKAQSFDGSDAVDAHYISLNRKFDALRKKEWFSVWIAVAAGSLGIIAIIADAIRDSENMGALAILGMLLFIGAIFVPSIMSAVRITKFAQTVTTEIEGIKSYVCESQGITAQQFKQKSGLGALNAYEANKVLSCLFADEALRKKSISMSFIILIPSVIGGVIIGLAISAQVLEIPTTAMFVMLGIGAATVIAGIAVYMAMYTRLIKSQQALYEAEPEKYADYLDFMAEHKKYRTKNSLLLIPSLLVSIGVGIASWFIIPVTVTMRLYGTVFFGLIVFIAFALVGSVVQYRGFNKKVKHLIEKITAPQPYKEPFDPDPQKETEEAEEIDNSTEI